MVRRLALFISALLLAVVIVLAAAGFWLLRTPAGARWALKTGAGAAGAQLTIEGVEGRLAGELRLEGVRLDMEGLKASLDRLQLNWLPLRLLRGELAVTELSLGGGELRASPAPPGEEEEAAAEFTWPRLSGLALQLDGVIERLHLEDIAFHPPEGAERRLDELTVRVALDEGVLTMSGLDTAGEGYRLRGELAASFVSPLLRLDLHLELPGEIADLNEIALAADLGEGDGALLTGPVELKGVKGEKPILDLNALLALTDEKLSLRSFELTHALWGGVLRGEGELALSEPFEFSLQAEAEGFDLAQQTGVAAELGGDVEAEGTLGDYRGRFELSSRGTSWRQGRLAGRFAGGTERIALSELAGAWLRGSLAGEATVDWSKGVQLSASLEGRGLDPAVLDPRWSGRVNVDLEGSLAGLPGEPLLAEVKADLLDSRLRGRPLNGRADLSMRGEDLRIAALELHGDGFDLAAQGRLRQRVQVTADVRKLGGLVPGAAGSLRVRGWLRWREGQASGQLGLRGEGLAMAGVQAASLRGELERAEGQPYSIDLQAGGLVYDQLRLNNLELALQGTPERHRLRLSAGGPEGQGRLLAQGGWRGEFWSGTIEQLQGETNKFGSWRLVEPVALELGAGRVRTAPLRLEGAGGMALELAADLSGSPLQGTLEGTWKEIDLSLLAPWLPGTAALTGRSSGEADLRLAGGDRSAVEGSIMAAGRLTQDEFTVAFSRVEGTVTWDAGGLDARLEAHLEEGGLLAADLDSKEPPLGFPRNGILTATWEGIDLSRLRPWLPANLRLRGELRGKARGEWLPGRELSLIGSVGIDRGEVAWQSEEGEVAFDLRAAGANWRWRGESLQGDVDLTLAEVGQMTGSFSLPLPARVPTTPRPGGPLSVVLQGEMREQGLLSAIFPGLLRESEGELALELNVGGSWRSPDLGGRLHLSGAGAYLPAAGIEIEDVEARAEFLGQSLRLVSFSARSGPGRIEGEGEVELEQWRPASYRATLKGERFQAVDLPELQLLVSPDLRLSGTMDSLRVRGEVKLPELVLMERERPEMVQESPDVVIVGREAPADAGDLPIALDMRVTVVLGERVLIRYAGVDARLAGRVEVMAEGVEDITAQGEIRVVEGIYAAYGVQLRIVRGRILYAGGPLDRPTLDILALRTIGEVKAGVRVSGTPRNPVVNLYSEPGMPDTDVLAYIVLGHPVGGDRESAGLLMGAAGALLSRGESAVLQDKLKRQLGVDVLTIESGAGEVESSMVTIGKYLSPRLYISYGQSLFSASNVAKLRYQLGERWEVESKMGDESGIDLFYKIEFK